MNIPRCWKKEIRTIAGHQVRLRGISEFSKQDAAARLEERARLWEMFFRSVSQGLQPALARLQTGIRFLDGAADNYCAPILEPIEYRIDEHNIVTRNRYGCLVLNSDTLCFADVDCFSGGFWADLFGGKVGQQRRLMKAIEKLCAEDAGLSVRLYRTLHGWRVILRGNGLTPGSAREAQLFASLQTDPLYVKLCRSQCCWRARLSPKPFHLGLRRYPHPQSSEQRAEEWINSYERKTAHLATCRLLEVYGPALRDEIIERHDAATLARHSDYQLG